MQLCLASSAVQNVRMLGRLGIWRHIVVMVSVAACSFLALTGFIGSGNQGERFEAKQITVVPSGSDGLRIREVVDEDFGNQSRHGYERIIPNNFGAPEEITASSPNADASVGLAETAVISGPATRIRLGDADTTYTGQHRYVLSYTLANAQISGGRLALDIQAGEKFETGRFEVILSGLTLIDPRCNVGRRGAVGGCTLTAKSDGYYSVVFAPLHAGDGVTIGGTIASVSTGVVPPLPERPTYRSSDRGRLTLILLLVGLACAAIVYSILELRGRNEVFSGGAAQAAFGQLPAPAALGGTAPSAPPTMLVSDAKLSDLATTEFAPPRGVDPWQGAVLLGERIDDSTVGAWFSALAASDAITLTQRDGGLVLGIGPRRSELDPSNSALVNQFLHGRSELRLGTSDQHFAAAWAAIKTQQGAAIQASGWWKRRPPSPGKPAASGPIAVVIVMILMLFFLGGSVVSAIFGVFRTLPLAIAFGAMVPAFVAYCCYATLLPVRSATGSALALLTESFRRFLVDSEGQHVEWAWKQGLLREYSAWAVSLGAAEAWEKALTHSNVPPGEYVTANPLLISRMAHSFATSHTPPTSSGSSGGGGFSGGSVGGGGGGGSSGSW